MIRAPLPASVGGHWAGLVYEADGPARPGLRVEVTGGRRLVLRQRDRVVLLGLQRAMHRGVYYARTGRYRSPLPPISTAEARRVRETSADDDTWSARWTHRFTDLLQAAGDGPLYAGRWTLAWGMPSWSVAAHWQRLPTVDPDQGHITWFGYGDPVEDQRDILPLRRLAPHDAARVRSYRRQVREGVLPPALLWWVSGLDTLLVLDGHDRIAAALAEHTVPAVVVLAPARGPTWAAGADRHIVRQYEGRLQALQTAANQGDELAMVNIANITRRFASQLNDVARSEGRTRAWPLPGGRAAWQQQAAQLARDWTIGPAG
ncbi:hypothetical protein ACFFWC_31765 [Plantactinospora siamensis]|uniref:Uncharacterized protein n=1 Tax=Plantactinospora siamensis TaxID=555372 RepID=A0ABV6P337_9ACTN